MVQKPETTLRPEVSSESHTQQVPKKFNLTSESLSSKPPTAAHYPISTTDEDSLKRFARHGGPDLTDIRGVSIHTMPQLGVMTSNNGLNSTVRQRIRRIRRVSLYLGQLGPRIREILSRYIVPMGGVRILVLPRTFTELKRLSLCSNRHISRGDAMEFSSLQQFMVRE
ncbi:unnamed protein product [Aspergillus oryzae]|nr:unnamed protein product [Aspergillus oryzae]GMF97031.1 unnamed protein product [Aspergillus oryzae]GMG07852.1 unnamed protein product [Aspergillus oryzae]